MTFRPLIVLTLEGLTTSALSCYGCSWNSTPAIDALAATGCVWDRWTATNDQPLTLLKHWMSAGGSELDDWLTPWKTRGPVDLLTDDRRLSDLGIDSEFDTTLLVEPSDAEHSADVASEIEETQFGRLIASAIERDARGPWSVLWLHSRFLSQRWDAPRELFPIEADEADDTPSEEVELLSIPGSEMAAKRLENLPLIFDAARVPRVKLDDQSHPDLVNAWMRTYGCQIRLLDLLIEILLQSLCADDPQFVLAGASGFSLGQNGWIGHSAGPLRSCDLRLPMVVSDRGPIRSAQLTPTDKFPQILRSLTSDSARLVSPSQWCQLDDEFKPRVTTNSRRAAKVVTTSRWSFIRDLDSTDHLFLKPDDVEDANDIGRLRSDVIDRLIANGE